MRSCCADGPGSAARRTAPWPKPCSETYSPGLSLHLRGSQFHLKVWRSLLTVPESCLVSYARLARMADSPGASRAVGGAVASNPIGYLIPCHRVLRTDGHLGGFKWGLERKKAMIAYEAALSDIDFRTAEGARDR